MTTNFENYPPLPPGKFAFAVHGEGVVHTSDTVREAQRQMARECWKWLDESMCFVGADALEERFGPFDE